MDKETVIESIVEIANAGSYTYEAIELLNEELAAYGYSDSEIQSLIKVASRGGKIEDKSKYANSIYSILEDQTIARIYLPDINNFYGLTLLNM
ncbi:MAG TPA: hypothetical protein ENJ35_01520 [Gammaproteobacteria bacterium]|nr:hypothetical protein [Gammaproteobacteria bacterium]